MNTRKRSGQIVRTSQVLNVASAGWCALPDGLYRMEFTSSQIVGPGGRINLMAAVADGLAKGWILGETLDISTRAPTNIYEEADRHKADIYIDCLAVEWEKDEPDREDFHYQPFIAEVVNQKIVAIGDGRWPWRLLPLAASQPAPVTWSEAGGWDWAPACPSGSRSVAA